MALRTARAWAPKQYLCFESNRLRPALDLLERISIDHDVKTIIDLGSGTGNITPFMLERWPTARILCVDSSLDMLESAKNAHEKVFDKNAQIEYLQADFESFKCDEPVDLIFSNAALHWVSFDVHRTLLPKLMSYVKPGGCIAFQMPDTRQQASHVLMSKAADKIAQDVSQVRWVTTDMDPDEYYKLLVSDTNPLTMQLWTTEYIQLLEKKEGSHPVVDFVSSTGLGPYVNAISEPSAKEAFKAAYAELISQAYPVQPNQTVLFPFKRFFCIAYRDEAQ
ncbi:trans-aconitate 2-methyltransferase [Thraustotheca clavata]|uniref:Trans-aconitate 2-methyltransferase n=1 Tax=Thraustotheca clavata TaxID=74557 RepID=A0A1V9ZYL1_9STRA|nr:trans-aconitate 2-methyltransferase [Thraustotheca clavata]